MSNHVSSYQKRRRDIDALLREVERVRKEAASDAEALAIIAKAIKKVPGGEDILLGAYEEVVKANRSDLGAAIHKAFFAPANTGASLQTEGASALTVGARDITNVLGSDVKKDANKRSILNFGLQSAEEEAALKERMADIRRRSNYGGEA